MKNQRARKQPPPQETVTVAVYAKGRYLRHLPALYDYDEFMGRFIMLFESFWGPINHQIDSIWHYFDPLLTPAELLPWLAAWFDLALDERWPEDAQRKLIKSAIQIYRQRGRKGMAMYLEAITGVPPKITEHFARNFAWGANCRLGHNFALGNDNAPHTMTIEMELAPLKSTGDPQQDARRAQERRQMIEDIIKAEKPAHVAYKLHIIESETQDNT